MKSIVRLLLGAVCSYTMVCFAQTGATTQRIVITDEQIESLGIATTLSEAATEIPRLTVSAQVVVPPDRERVVDTPVGGLVSRILVAEGDTVAAGQLLAQLNSPELLALQREYLKNASELQLAETVYRRDRQLQQEGIIPQSRWEENRSRYEIAKSHTQEARQLLSIAGMSEAEIEKLRRGRRLNGLLALTAPIGGTVLERTAAVGQRLASNASLFRLADIGRLWLELAIPQDRIDEIVVGDRVRIANKSVYGDIVLLGQSVDRQTQSVMARAEVQGPSSELRPGQTVTAQIVRMMSEPVYRLPQSVLVKTEGRDYVFVRSDDGFVAQAVRLVGRQEDTVFVAGLTDAERPIVVRGTAALKAKWLETGEGGGD